MGNVLSPDVSHELSQLDLFDEEEIIENISDEDDDFCFAFIIILWHVLARKGNSFYVEKSNPMGRGR